MSFNCYFRTVINPGIEKHRRISALRCCIAYLHIFEEPRSYTKTIQRFEDTFGVSLRACDSALLSEEILLQILMAVVRERNLKLETLRRQDRQNLRRKLQRRFKITK